MRIQTIREKFTQLYRPLTGKTTIGEAAGAAFILQIVLIMTANRFPLGVYVLLAISAAFYSGVSIYKAVLTNTEMKQLEQQASESGLYWDQDQKEFRY